jgi:hypothetical protein
VPKGIDLMYLPPVTPELQPAERLWPLMREDIAKVTGITLDHVQDALVARCLQPAAQPEVVRGATPYHWLPLRRNRTDEQDVG